MCVVSLHTTPGSIHPYFCGQDSALKIVDHTGAVRGFLDLHSQHFKIMCKIMQFDYLRHFNIFGVA